MIMPLAGCYNKLPLQAGPTANYGHSQTEVSPSQSSLPHAMPFVRQGYVYPPQSSTSQAQGTGSTDVLGILAVGELHGLSSQSQQPTNTETPDERRRILELALEELEHMTEQIK
jgi:hypothetical protein